MGRFDEYNEYSGSTVNNRQRDFVLNMNEFAHILSKTDGSIKCAVGPYQTSLSQQETPVIFNTKTKRFEECNDYDKAKQLFISAPEGWYVVLKNPTSDGQHPQAGRPNQSPSNMEIGKKVNIFGPVSFALHPGQMAKVIQGHRLRSNQYLLARVYDADAANKNEGVVTDVDGKDQKTSNKYFPGQMLVIKGTEVSFYIPPTGIEVYPSDGDGNDYIRDAVTLERLEYCILKDENGNKRYLHGPDVVFPKPTETFVKTAHGGYCFRAIELSKISGIYVKVIAEYEEKGVVHPIGEELFITGNEQMIYYPRPEHAIISYDGKYMHHAIAIPEGEGRYVMNRETGEIETVVGPKMYLPDPRKEVIVKRKLTTKQCQLWYPGNYDVLAYNEGLNEKSLERGMKKGTISDPMKSIVASAFTDAASMDCLESNAGISRGTSYTKPRTITLDNKYDGVVTIDVWTGYAINVVSKSGKREVVVGPTTKLLDYDETLEVLELSTGRPKTTDNLIKTAYLRVDNNKISDLIKVQTKDFVDVQIKVSYCVDFLEDYKDKWFSVENYVKYMCDRERSLLKREAKKYTIEEFYANASDIVRNICLNLPAEDEDRESECGRTGRLFKENGMLVHDVEVLSIAVDSDVARILESHQEEMIRKCLDLSDATKKMEIVTKLAEYEKKENELKHQNQIYKIELDKKVELERLAKEEELNEKIRAQKAAEKEAEYDLQVIADTIAEAKLEREKKEDAARIATEKELTEIEKVRQEAYAKTVAKIMESIQPDLVAALTSKANADMLGKVTGAMSPIAIAKDESVAEVTNQLLRGTSLEGVLEKIGSCKIPD